nr:hypothetical protein BaRGS_016527 [Batillaria attramentaria]
MDSWVRVGVPRNHQVMISVVSLVLQAYDPLCRHDSVSLFLGDHPAHETLVWKVCGIRPKAALYQTDSFLVYFVSDVAFAYAGFRLAFSFHNDSFLPEQLPDGTWNCSVPYFGEFRQHFPCDVKPQCAAGEDEVDCPYTSEWREVSNMLRLFDFVRVYIGLKSAGSNLPLLYRYVWQWTDQSIAYFLNIVSLNNRDSCAFLARELDVIKAKSYCMPVYVRCNGVYDCPGHEDELDCESYTCPGFYRCRGSRICLHASHVCDDLFQCPQQDDELFCELSCPEGCVEAVAGEGFKSLEELRTLDLRGCPMTTFPRNVFKGLENLDTVYADNYKLCCPVTLPDDFNPLRCHAPSDEISSCDALLRSDIYRVLLFLFAVLAVFGNVGSFIYRVFFESVANSLGFGAFVIHLCASDFLMGVYLAMIGVADQVYQGTYLWNDVEWKNSAGCKIAGFLSLLSSEVSAFIICLITLDRFLVLRFPFSQVHFRKRSAHVVCAIAWVVGVILAATPLFPFASHWQFYSQTGICIPLPITRSEFPGHDYSFGILIVLNFVLFLFIASGQIFIYWSVRTNSISADDSSKKSKDLTIARRLITIAMSDFLCWFPIGLLGLMASYGTAVPGEVNVAMAIIALPVNSALNPFLYTLNVIMERRRRLRELRLQKSLASRSELRTKGTDVACRCYDSRGSKEDAMTFIHTLITTGTLSMDNIINSLKKKFPAEAPALAIPTGLGAGNS